jgi:hypothetical protein
VSKVHREHAVRVIMGWVEQSRSAARADLMSELKIDSPQARRSTANSLQTSLTVALVGCSGLLGSRTHDLKSAEPQIPAHHRRRRRRLGRATNTAGVHRRPQRPLCIRQILRAQRMLSR